MKVQFDVLVQLLKERNWSQATLAEEANLSKNTISNWKKSDHDANRSAVERAARALGTSVKKLTTPPTEGDKPSKYRLAELELVAYRYGVNPQTILNLAPLIFSVVAKRAIKTRLDELDEWYSKLAEAAKLPAGIKRSEFYDYETSDEELSYSSFAETYWEERNLRESGDLGLGEIVGEFTAGLEKPIPKYGTDLFFQTLLKLDSGGEIEDYDEDTANLKNCDDGEDYFYYSTMMDTTDIIFGDYNVVAHDYLTSGDVRIHEIPSDLLKKGKENECASWVIERGKALNEERKKKASTDFNTYGGGADA
jgi:transcriptional regulator with XRE-family HTH domain